MAPSRRGLRSRREQKTLNHIERGTWLHDRNENLLHFKSEDPDPGCQAMHPVYPGLHRINPPASVAGAGEPGTSPFCSIVFILICPATSRRRIVRSARMNLRLLQLGDSALPIGGYSHSWGLEAAIDRGLVRDAQSLETGRRLWLRSRAGAVRGRRGRGRLPSSRGRRTGRGSASQ